MNRKSFLFIIALTPSDLLSPLRRSLFELFLKAMKSQTYDSWEALLIGEEDKTDGKLKFVKTPAISKQEKFLFAIDYLKSLKIKPDYIIRLDDDDLISPTVLTRVSQLDFDCYADSYHAFYDIVTGKISLNKREWLANTVIHKFEHAIAEIQRIKEDKGVNTSASLLALDHNLYWEKYYRHKKIIWSDKRNSVYLRILSPTSITSHLTANYSVWSENVQEEYKQYVKGYGPWVYKTLSDFIKYEGDLKLIWEKFSGSPFEKRMSPLVFLDYVKHSFRMNSNRLELFPEKIINTSYRVCTRCILDTKDDPYIQFNEHGICEYCTNYDALVKTMPTGEEKKKQLLSIIERIKLSGKNDKYNCLLGVSGGTDSSYVAYLCKEYGLRPLVVHFDNGWNSELAVQNIQNILQKLNFDMVTYVINWEEFKDLQVAYLKASVVDIEAITDHAILASLHLLARKHHIKYIISGFNYVTEAIMPRGWTWDKSDWSNIKSIHKRFGTVKLKTFPRMGFVKKIFNFFFLKTESVRLLNYIDYNQKEVKNILAQKLDWRDYGGKHYESLFTRFYQQYILPEKFEIDKRKAHLSNLICSRQITRNEALDELSKNMYNPETLKNEKEYVIKKLGLAENEFEQILHQPIRKHDEFFSEKKYFSFYFHILKIFRPLYKR